MFFSFSSVKKHFQILFFPKRKHVCPQLFLQTYWRDCSPFWELQGGSQGCLCCLCFQVYTLAAAQWALIQDPAVQKRQTLGLGEDLRIVCASIGSWACPSWSLLTRGPFPKWAADNLSGPGVAWSWHRFPPDMRARHILCFMALRAPWSWHRAENVAVSRGSTVVEASVAQLAQAQSSDFGTLLYPFTCKMGSGTLPAWVWVGMRVSLGGWRASFWVMALGS